MNKYVRKSLKIILWIIASVIILVVAIALSLNIPAVQNFVKDKAINYLKGKTKTEVRLESIKIALPKDVVLNKFYIEDLNKDTLLYAERLAVDISLFKLLKNTVEVNNIELKNIRANVKRITPDTTFNFSFLVDAFMSDQKKPEEKVDKDTTSALKFSVDKVSFEDIGLTYRDDVAGNDVKLYLGAFKTKLKTFDLENQHYVIKDLTLENTSLKYLQQKPLVKLVQHLTNSVDSAEKEQGKLPLIEVENFAFSNVKVNYDDQISTTKAIADVNDLGLVNLKVDLTNSKYTVDDARLNKSNIIFAFKPAPSNDLKKVKDTVVPEKSPLGLIIKNISLAENNLQFDNLGAKPAAKGMDFNHLKITGLNFGAGDVNYSANGITANVKNGSLKEKSGFALNELKGNAVYNDKQIKLSNFVLKTPNTTVENATELNFTSMDDLTKHPERVKLNLAFKNTTIGLKDAGYFSDAIPANYRNEKIKLNAEVNGYLNNLNIPRLQISGLKNTQIDISGTAKGLPDINKTFLDLNIKKLYVTKSDILVAVPRKSLPPSIELPNVINAKGNFKGSMTDFNTNMSIQTDMGGAILVAGMKGPKGRESYKADVNLNNFNVGRLLKMQPKLGRVSVKANVAGTGLDPKKINAKFNARVLSAYYNKYTYRNLNLSGTYANQNINIKSNMPDSNANFNLDAKVNMAGKYPAVKADLNLKQVNLQALNFSPTVLSAAGVVKVDLQTADADYLNGTVNITGLQLVKDAQRINVDTISVNAKSTATENELTLKSEILSAKVDGKYQLTKIGSAFINEINKYYAFGEVTKIPDQRMRFFVQVYDSKLLKQFVPQLTVFKSSQFYGLIDTQKDSLQIKGNFPQIVYGDFKVDTTVLNINNDNNKLDYGLTVKRLQSPSIALFNTEISGDAANNILGVNIFLRDRQLKNKYVIGGNFQSINKDFKFTLDPQKLLLDYEKWVVSQDNYIQFGASGILVNQFQISNSGQSLAINSNSTQPNAPLTVEFKDFQLETLTKFAETDTTLVGGRLNGTANVKDLASTPKFEANLTIDQLRYQKDQLGTLRVAVNNNTENAFEVNVALAGVHDLRVNGFYYTAPQSALDLTVNIDKIEMKNIESLSQGQLKNGTGTLTGALTVKGALTAPRILGDLTFNNAGINVAYVNSYFRMPNEKISFTNEGISFNNFTLIDSLNQKATINGKVYTTDFKNYRFGLDIRTNNFRAINSTAADNEMIYGTVFLTSNIKVRGDLNQPDVNMSVNVNKGTKFFFALPANDPSIIDQEGIVQFIDADAPPFNGQRALKVDSISKSPVKGMNLVANISVDPEAELNVVVDPSNGDALNVKGDANLNATIDPSGKISLTGRYEIIDGSYNLSVGPLGKKAFRLVKGSTIIWTGEPTTANVNLSALYEVNAAPIDLLNQPDLYEAKTKLPFQVYLMMKGELLKPTISFKIDLPENERNALGGQVYTKLINVNRDESELNKQVFALLALNRFIASNPFQSLAGGGGGVSTLARSSVSKLLTEQLNNLTSDLIQGVDLNFGVNSSEDYSSGSLQQKTDLEVGLSKKLLNDRLTVSVGSSFALEGPQAPGEKSTDIAGNVNVEYALSADGRYRLRAYRRNQNDVIVQGQIIETGLGFTLVVDYNKFREIFQKKRVRRTRNIEQKAQDEKTN
ncbi:translocation/assembly module TamB domain-containing protein [Pedobacter aquatilis]|uniref:translocation/assembly module TamB domain-containing protein n=1 Tax=Pedobacter aquatilis TaxID=351343 RepID=UPI0025B579F9|nr:translocation/assembly module TamB domain-containing protein [Pedobacter aquatilis]MDN3587217.1 translocation/assembly module TamB domain-containing protein [Pedobacter aquatilis]